MKNTLTTILSMVVLALSVLGLTQQAAAVTSCSGTGDTAKDTVLSGAGRVGTSVNCQGKEVNNFFRDIVQLLSLVVGIVTVIMVIIAGFKYVTSSGDSGKVASAKNTIVYALIGLIIVALAQVIVKFVIDKAQP